MRAFLVETGQALSQSRNVPPDMFTKWLTLITQSEQSDKEFLKEICKSDEVIAMAVGVLASLSVDEATRLAYSRRKDEMTNYYAAMQQLEESLHRAEESDRRAKESDRRAEEYRRQLEESERRVEEYRRQLEVKSKTP